MRVRVRLFGLLPRHLPGHGQEKGMEVEVPGGLRIGDLLARLKIPAGQDTVVTVNGMVQKRDRILKDGDLIYIFQSIAGG